VLIELGGRLHTMDGVLHHMVSRNVNDVDAENLTLGQRIADTVASTMGSLAFYHCPEHAAGNLDYLNATPGSTTGTRTRSFCSNLMLSFQAAYAAPFIMMSQNRQSSKDRIAAEIDHQVNQKAELEVGLLMQRMNDLERGVAENQRELKEMLKK